MTKSETKVVVGLVKCCLHAQRSTNKVSRARIDLSSLHNLIFVRDCASTEMTFISEIIGLVLWRLCVVRRSEHYLKFFKYSLGLLSYFSFQIGAYDTQPSIIKFKKLLLKPSWGSQMLGYKSKLLFWKTLITDCTKLIDGYVDLVLSYMRDTRRHRSAIKCSRTVSTGKSLVINKIVKRTAVWTPLTFIASDIFHSATVNVRPLRVIQKL